MTRFAIALVLLAAACGPPPNRLPLPVPYLPTNGATTVPGNGVGIGAEFGSALLSPDLHRGELRATSVGLGIKDRISISLGNPHTQGSIAGQAANSSLQQFRTKILLVTPHRRRPAISLFAGYAWGEQRVLRRATAPVPQVDTLQNDRMVATELALPAEALIRFPLRNVRTSIFAGPRVTFLRYNDWMRPDDGLKLVMPGAVGGIHFSANILEIFLENTLAYVPRRAVGGGTIGGYLTVMPALGAVVRIGPAFKWR
jgi:hypothetical protein